MATTKRGLTDDEVEAEIRRLQMDPFVALAAEEQRQKYRRRQYMYKLRWLENRGRELANEGETIESLRAEEQEEIFADGI